MVLVVALGSAMPNAAAAKKKPRVTVKTSVGETSVHRVGDGPPALPGDVRDAVMTTLRRYLRAASAKPLRTGTVDDAAIQTTLGLAAIARLGGADRQILVDERLPRADRVVLTTSPVQLTGLADEQGRVVVVTARLDATTKAKTKQGAVTIRRTGELVLTPDAGAWKITGYDLAVDRIGKGLRTVADPTPTPAAPAASSSGTRTR